MSIGSPDNTARVTTERDGHVLLIGLNRPAKRNAFDVEMFEQLGAAYEELADNPDLRAGVLFGHGGHFSGGLDLHVGWPALRERGPAAMIAPGRYCPFATWGPPVPKPIVMAPSGISFTVAVELAVASDIVIAADDTRFCVREVERGVVPLGGATFRFPHVAGWGNAMRYVLTAEEFGAREAMRIGLVQEVVPPGAHVDRALTIAQRIAAHAPLAVQASLANGRLGRGESEAPAVRHLADIFDEVFGSAAAAASRETFTEGRQARLSKA